MVLFKAKLMPEFQEFVGMAFKKMRIHNIVSIVLAFIAIILTITEIASTLATLGLIVFISGAETRKR